MDALLGSGHRSLHKGEHLTTIEFIEKARLVHGDKYDYSDSEYVGSKGKIKIVCRKHGVFHQIPADHISGHGCRRCYDDGHKRWSIDQDDFLKMHYKEKGAYWCANELDKTDHAVRGRAQILRLTAKRRFAHEHLPAFMWNNLLNRVRGDGYLLDFDQEFVWQLYLRQEGKCALTGWPIVFGKTHKENTVSIDRIDSNGDYTKDNVQLTHKIVNRCKLNTPEAFFYQMCDAVARNRKADFVERAIEWRLDVANDTEIPVAVERMRDRCIKREPDRFADVMA